MFSVSLEERIAAVRATGLADEIIVEEYEGQKIDDIRRLSVDIFTVGSDWVGYFDYLNEFCKVVYLPRTEGVSSSDIRAEKSSIRLGMVGYAPFLKKFYNESKFVNAVDVVGVCVPEQGILEDIRDKMFYTTDYDELLSQVDAVYIHAHPTQHYTLCKSALEVGKHVMCESPLAMDADECNQLINTAEDNGLILMEATRTAYITAYSRMLLLLKSGKIGKVVSVDATCTSLSSGANVNQNRKWGSLEAWGPTTLLPVFQILGTDYKEVSYFTIRDEYYDTFTKVNFTFKDATACIKVGTGVKSEGELIISGTKGYIYVPAPWWKTDYFEIRYENPADNKRYFYQVDGEGIRYELVALASAIRNNKPDYYIGRDISISISKIMNKYKESFA